MGRKRLLNVAFPLSGVNRKAAYRQQAPYTTPDALNVRTYGTIEERGRGGSRPGQLPQVITDFGAECNGLTSVTCAFEDSFTAWTDLFDGSDIESHWTQASWATNAPDILDREFLTSVLADADTAVVRDALTIDTTETYYIEAMITPSAGAYHGKYQIFLRMDNTTPDYETDGIKVEWVITGTNGAYTGSIKKTVSGVESTLATFTEALEGDIAWPVWLAVKVVGDNITVYTDAIADASNVACGTAAGSRIGLGSECTVSGGRNLVNAFRVQYYSTGSVASLRTILVAFADGYVWYELPYGRMNAVASNCSLRSDVPLQAVQSGQKLYIADYGEVAASGDDGVVSGAELSAASVTDWTDTDANVYDYVVVINNVGGDTVEDTYQIDSIAAGALTLTTSPGDGTCSYRVERAPKIFDPIAGTLTLFTASTGQVPTGCPLISNYLDRIVLSGAEIAPHVWYMARKSDEDDWDYSQEDVSRAVAGTDSAAGMPGQAIVAQVVHSDDYMIFGGVTTLWRMRGDPAYGGTLDQVSHKIGIASATSYCFGPSAELVFLSNDGVYALGAGGDAVPIPVSGDTLPKDLKNFNNNTTIGMMEFDIDGRGVWIFTTRRTWTFAASSTQIHWWLDWGTKAFWPVQFVLEDHEPLVVHYLNSDNIENNGVVLGVRDGRLRKFHSLAESDTGQEFSSYVRIGPVPLAKDSFTGAIVSIDAELAEDSGDVDWELFAANTFEGAAKATSTDFSGTWEAGLNYRTHPGGRGQAFCLELTGTPGRKWAVETITVIVRETGPRRKL